MGKMSDSRSDTLEPVESILMVYYLEALVILKHLQRPGVVEHVTVDEWIGRVKEGQHYIIGVKEHKTAAQQVAAFALSEEEAHWFDVYYRLVRPQLLRPTRKRKRDVEGEMEGGERFFLSTAGKQIYNASNDLNQLHTRYNLPPVTSQMARRTFEMATKSFTDAEKLLVADYLTHSSATVEKHYRMRQTGNNVKALQIVEKLGDVLSAEPSGEGTSCEYSGESTIPEPSGEGTSRESSGESTSHESLEEPSSHSSRSTRSTCSTAGSAAAVKSLSESEKEIEADLQILLRKYPVTINGPQPKRELLKHVSCWRKAYERWEKRQLKLQRECARSSANRSAAPRMGCKAGMNR